jgi:subtilisin-like proprotein convertase family protein
MNFRVLLFLTFAAFLFSGNHGALAQLTVTQNGSAQQLGDNIAGSNISVTNATVTGAPNQFGTFNYVGNDLGINSGIIMSTGNVADAIGPNTLSGTGTNLFGNGNPDLTALSGNQTYDAAILEFDFQVQASEVEFNFIFMSEEYNEYVGSFYNDVFAFYISGPGIPVPENLAVLPNTSTPISINNINNGSNSQYFVDNTNNLVDIEFDGFTVPLKAVKGNLIPCETYTLSLRIADAADGILDAAVLFEENSLIQPNLTASSYTFSSNNTALEGCYDASFTFYLDTIYNQDVVIPLNFGGTAVNGVDYAMVDDFIVIPAGQTSGTVIIDAFLDDLTEGQEFVQFYFEPSPCAPMDSVMLFIDDYVPVEYDVTPTDVTCNGYQDGQVDISVFGGFPPYTMTLTDSATGNVMTYNSFPATGLDAGTYFVEIIDAYGCSADELVSGNYLDTQVSPIPDNKNDIYTSSLPISGFGNGETIQSEGQVQSICMTLEHSRLSDLEIILTAPNGTQVFLKEPFGGALTNLGEPCAVAPNDIGNSVTSPGIGYNYCWQNTASYGTMVAESSTQTYSYTNICDGSTQIDHYLPADSYLPFDSFDQLIGAPMNGNWSITINDNVAINDGFIFDWSLTLQSNLVDTLFTINEPPLPTISSTVMNPTCGQSDGSIDLTVSTGLAPFTFLWDTGATTEDLAGIPAGAYTVDITDASGCVYSHQVDVSNSGTLLISGAATNETCYQDSNGLIDLNVIGATTPVSYSWSSGQTTEDIQNLAPATYTVTVQDGSGCVGVQSFTIDGAPQINISETITNEYCSDGEGMIDISVIGAVAPVTYFWDGVASTQNIDNLASGTYNFSLVDANNCSTSGTYEIINLIGNCLPDCDLEISSSTVLDDQCGQGVGQIDLYVSTTNGPTQTIWSNGMTSNQISNLTFGDYDVTITDAEGCEVTSTFTVGNFTGGLSIDSLISSDASCGNNDGAISSYVTGGAQPYSYSWSNGVTQADITNAPAGTYTLTVTDDNNCTTALSTEIISPLNTLEISYSYVSDSDCGLDNGWISFDVSGGAPPYLYNWNTAYSGAQNQYGLAPGNYSCVVTDANGCSITSPVYTVANNSGTLVISDLNVDHEVCFDAQGSIEVIVTGGSSSYIYSWSNAAPSSPLITGLSAGTYFCDIIDVSGCSISTGPIVILNESGTLSIDDLSTVDEVCNNGNGSLNLSVSGGNMPLTFQWSNFSTSQNLSNLSAGTYTCTVTDAFGCEVYASAAITNTSGTLSIDNFVPVVDSCGIGSVDLIVSGGAAPISYVWSNGATTEDLANVSNGTYSVDVTDNLGCAVSGTTTLSMATTGMTLLDAVVMNEQCGDANGSIDLVVSGGTAPYTFAWSNGTSTEDLTNLSAGTYSCVVTDADGCTFNTNDFTVNNTSGGFTIHVLPTTDDYCSSGTGAISVSALGGATPYSFAWSNGATTEDISGLFSGTYTLIATDANGCSTTVEETIYNDPGTLTLDNISITDEICGNSNGAIDITVSGGTPSYSYFWSNASTNEDVSGISAGTYTVFIFDSLGCALTADNLVVNNTSGQLQIEAITVTNENCNDSTGTIDINISGNTGPLTFLWSNGETTEDLQNLTSGVYSGTATDVNGCSVSFSASVQNNAGGLSVFGDVTNICNAQINEGAIDLLVTGATGTVTYSWSNGETTEDLVDLPAGTYTVTVSDDNNCAVSATFDVLLITTIPTIDLSSVSPASCATCEDGWINISSYSANGQNTFLWSNGSTSEDINNLNPGTYDVVVTGPDGCSISQSFVVGNTDPYQDVTECSFVLYPNPSDGLIEIDFIQWGVDTVTLKLLDAQGRIVYNGSADVSGTSGTFQLDFSDLAYGVYFLHMSPECGKGVHRIVIQE